MEEMGEKVAGLNNSPCWTAECTADNSMNPITSEKAPAAIGPYSLAMRTGNLIFCSGQIPIDPSTGRLVEDEIEVQTKRVLANIDAVLEAAQVTRQSVVKTTIFLINLEDFQLVNSLYAEFFGDHKPARSTVQVARLPLDSRIEIEMIIEA